MRVNLSKNKTRLFRLGILLMFFLNIGIIALAQTEKKQLTFKGQISVENGSENEIVSLSAKGSLGDKQQQQIDPSGKYVINLDFNQDYVLIFSCKGYFPKKILIDTHVPAEAYASIEFEPSELFVSLYRERSYIDPSFFEKPAGRVFYNSTLQKFDQESFQAEIDVRRQIQQAEKKNQQLSKESLVLDKELAAERNEHQKQLQKVLDDADRKYKAKEYAQARAEYKEALTLDTDNSYCKDRIAELDYLMENETKEMAKNQAEIEKVNHRVKEGDAAFSVSDYITAKQHYMEALAVQPKNEVVLAKLKKVNESIRQQEIDRTREQVKQQQAANRTEMAYEQQITAANQFFAQSQYEEALAAYKRALILKPEDINVKKKVEETNQRIQALIADSEKKKKEKERLSKQLLIADQKFNQGLYEEAKKGYEQVLVLSPSDSYSKSQIIKIGQLVSDHQKSAEKQKLYETAIAEANAAYKKGDFNIAGLRYADAAKVKPEEMYPQNKIKEIEEVVKQRAEIARLAEEEKAQKTAKALTEKKAFQENITKGDQALANKNYQVARRSYEDALVIFPNEKYPKVQIEVINKALEGQENAEKMKYQEREKALKDSITKVQNTLFSQVVTKADDAIKAAHFDEAIALYAQGCNICPEKQKELNGLIEKVRQIQQKQNLQSDNYRTIVDGADRYFKNNEWTKALGEYRKAALSNSKDSYVTSQILLIQSKTKEYQNLVEQGDLFFKEKKFDQARVKYTQAMMVCPSKEINDKLDNLASQANQTVENKSEGTVWANSSVLPNKGNVGQEKVINYNYTQTSKPFFSYKDAIQKADSAFMLKDYTTARFYYNRALENNSEDHYVIEQIEKIKSHLNGTSSDELVKEYDFLITKGDQALKEQKYSIARYFYNRATTLKPQEKYPLERLALINATTNSKAESDVDREYHDIIKKAESALVNNQLSVSRYYFQQALLLKPNDEYATKEINMIQTKINQGISELSEQEYKNIVKKGDEAFKSEQYTVARFYYLQALTIHPDDSAVEGQLKKISAFQQKYSSE